MKYLSLLIILFSFSVVTSAQDNIISRLEKSEPGQGRVKINQDPAIANLIGKQLKYDTTEKQGTFKMTGYRVQVYAGSNSRESKAEAQRLGARVKEYRPDIKVYTTFVSPRWICRVGDFRSIEEANAAMRDLKKTGVFKEVSIVREQVTITL
ncbi:SPOR domain-containing protein [Bacteroides sp. 519]|uniref:SPOR domain-containing protein n=1 Tax=Bacteroides sp. 519 TaxID=2302937 RepID=UPI0013D4DF5C|nr:SPOR domain-containing protein [Bacteroides sp. 519]NDV57830.1 SPOR domain-containing protein [Bacteroides sp. 519]